MKKIYKFYSTKQGEKAQKRIFIFSYIPATICALLFWISIYLIYKFQKNEIMVNVGVGILSSSFVTASFLVIDYFKQRAIDIDKRAAFLDSFELFLLDLVIDLPVLQKKNIENLKESRICICEYIILQHRKFHNCHKTILVNNADKKYVRQLMSESDLIVNRGMLRMTELFNSLHYQISTGAFSENETALLSSFYNYFKAMERAVQKDNTNALYYTAMWLTDLRRLIESIKELGVLNRIYMQAKEGNHYIPDYSDIEREEPVIVFRKEFSDVRMNSYKECFGKANREEN